MTEDECEDEILERIREEAAFSVFVAPEDQDEEAGAWIPPHVYFEEEGGDPLGILSFPKLLDSMKYDDEPRAQRFIRAMRAAYDKWEKSELELAAKNGITFDEWPASFPSVENSTAALPNQQDVPHRPK